MDSKPLIYEQKQITSFKPYNLIFGLEDKPPLGTTILVALQHFLILGGGLVYPTMLASLMGMSARQTTCFVSLTMVAWGVGAILMSMNKKGIGSGYLCPKAENEAFLSAVLLAAKTGGLSLLLGMSILGGIFESLLSRVVGKLRVLFPPEVSGVVTLMIGISITPISLSMLIGLDGASSAINTRDVWIGAITLFSIVGINIWGRGILKECCIMIGIMVGYISAYFLGYFSNVQWQQLGDAPLLSLPHLIHTGWSFDITLLPAFLIAGLASSLKCMGDVTTCQKINDPEWKRVDMKSIGGGMLADGLSLIFGGLIGAMPQATSSSNVGLSQATGTTSRRIGLAIGVILIVMAFFPKISMLISIMPEPVVGASLIFCICFIMMAGIQIVVSRMIDARKTFVIGISLVLGLSVDLLPQVYANVNPGFKVLCSSSLTLATVSVIVLNILSRIGIGKKKGIELIPAEDCYRQIADFMEIWGSAWGARREIVVRAASAMNEFMEALGPATGTVYMEVSFDEYSLDVDIYYQGELIDLPARRPSEDELLEDEKALAKLSGYLVRRYADRVKTEIKDGRSRIQLHFEH